MPGITTQMLVALGENGMKTVEDLAGCATDDLAGWTERKDGETKREPGFLDGFELSREEAEAIIMQARLKAGWVTEADLAPRRGGSSAGRSSRAEPHERGRTGTMLAQRRHRSRHRTAPGRGRAERLCIATRGSGRSTS